MEFLAPLLGRGVVAPAVAAALLLALARGRAAGRVACVAIGLAYAMGHALLRNPWPIAESTDRLALFAVGLALVAAALPGRPVAVAIVARVGVAIAGVAWWLGPLAMARPPMDAAWRLAVIALGLALPWFATAELARLRPGPTAPAVVLLATIGGAVVLLLSRTAFYAQLAGALAATLAVLVPFARGRGDLARGSGPAAALLAALLVAGVVLAEVPVGAAVLVGLAPAAAWLARPPARDAAQPRAARARTLLATTLPVLAGIVLAALAAPPPNPY